MKNMVKGLAGPKWVLIVRPKMPQILFAQFVCPSPKVLDFNEKRFHCSSIVRGFIHLFGQGRKYAFQKQILYFISRSSFPSEAALYSFSKSVLFRLLLHRLLNTDLLTFTQVSATSFDLFLHYILSQSKSISCVGSIYTVEIH